MRTSAQPTALLCLSVLTCSGLASTNNTTTLATTFETTNDDNKKFDMHHPAVKSVLMSYYNASYEALNDCFVTKHKTNTGTHVFCLIPKAEVKTINGNPTLYLLVYGEPLNTELARVTNGLSGLFTLSPLIESADVWRVTHSSPYIADGQAGFSQLKDLTLTQVGTNNYGWTGEIAYSGSGASGKDWVMYTPIDEIDNKTQTNLIKKVADINTYYEYNMTRNRGKLSIIKQPHIHQPHSNQSSSSWYPLLIERHNCDFDTSQATDTSECNDYQEDGYFEYDDNTNEYVEVFND